MPEYKHISDSKLAQIRNIINDDALAALDVMRDCAELAGVVSKQDYSDIMCENLRTIQDKCKNNKLHCVEVSGVKFPAVNCNY